jgi:hypothetical protein
MENGTLAGDWAIQGALGDYDYEDWSGGNHTMCPTATEEELEGLEKVRI